MNDEQQQLTPENGDIDSMITMTHVVYGLQAAIIFLYIPFVMAVIINHVKMPSVVGTWLESHWRWQMRTFWYGLLWTVIGVITIPAFGLGILVLTAVFFWVLYRVVKGWLALMDRKPL